MLDNPKGAVFDGIHGLDIRYAYVWYNFAAVNGSKSAKKNKPIIAKKMTAEQIAKAQELSREMLKQNPKLLK